MGVRRAVEEGQIQGDLRGGAEPFQPEFFAEDQPLAVPVPVAESREAAKPGRPKGSGNKRDRDVIEFIQNTRGDPRLALANVMAMTPAEVKKYFGFKGKGAADRAAEMWKGCTLGLLPFMASKPAVSVEVQRKETKLAISLGLTGTISPGAAARHGASVLDLLDRQRQIEQGEGLAATGDDAEAAAIGDAVANALKTEG